MNEEFTLEKLKISDRLVKLETKHEATCVLIKEIHTAVMGNGGVTGLKIEVDRLKEIEKSREKHGMIIYGSIAGLFIKAAWDFFKMK